ncbi:MAG: SDR family NAD(P)-dependent oxidoreductase [Myxococcota bacterium]
MPKATHIAEPIAVVGMSCRFPGGCHSPESYWQFLSERGDAIRRVPEGRWNLESLKALNHGEPLPDLALLGGWLSASEVKDFDAALFRMSPREARALDPKQRLMLEVAYEAMEHAQIVPAQLGERTVGVWAGTSHSEYLIRFYNRGEMAGPKADRYVGTGNDISFTSGRISAILGLEGPSVNLDTACSTSLVAIHQACEALRRGECDLALAGGVAMVQSPENNLIMVAFNMLSPDARCKAFDASANGYVRAEGAGMVALKRLDEATADGDNILAVIRGSAVNHNGLSDNLMAPDAGAQTRLINAALANAGLTPDEVDAVEAHGTGTGLGDPAEMTALMATYGQRSPSRPLVVSSVKTNIGHLEIAAGVAGFIKAVLTLQHKTFTPHLHLNALNPRISNDQPFTIPTRAMPFDAPEGRPRRMGVNSFGISGTNAHVILEAAPEAGAHDSTPTGNLLPLLLSASSDTPLRELAGSLAEQLTDSASLDTVAARLALGRMAHPRRLTVLARTTAEARDALTTWAAGQPHDAVLVHDASPKPPAVAMLFTGQGSQYAGMGKALYEADPSVRRVVDRCDELLRPHLGRSIKDVMFEGVEEAPLVDTAWTQPALFVLEVALATRWMTLGIQPDIMVGHSIGEIVAAYLAGVFSLEDALSFVVRRGALMSALPRTGSMVALKASAAVVQAALDELGGAVDLASDNGPESVVISGETSAVDAVVAHLAAQGIDARPLNVSHAFHSPLMEPMLEDLKAHLATMSLKPPSRRILSNVTGTWADESMATPAYWAQHVRGCVRFREAIEHLAIERIGVVLEAGPAPVLSRMARRVDRSFKPTWLASLREEQPVRAWCEALATAHGVGLPVSWSAWFDGHTPHIALPTYPMQRKTHWAEDPGPGHASGQAPTALPATPSAPAEVDPLQGPRAWRPAWAPTALSGAASPKGTWIVSLDAHAVVQPLVEALTNAGHAVISVRQGATSGPEGDHWLLDPLDAAGHDALLEHAGDGLQGWIHAGSLDAPEPGDDATGEAWVKAQHASTFAVLHAAQALLRNARHEASFVTLTRGGVSARPHEHAMLAQAPVWGLLRVLTLEHRDLHNVRIDLDPNAEGAGVDQLAIHIARLPRDEDQLAIRGTQWWACRLRPHTASGEPFAPRHDGCIVITGGLGALGLAVAGRLSELGFPRLCLLGRSGPKPAAKAAIAAMTARGTEVIVESVDISQREQVDNLFTYLDKKGVPVRAVLHAAGVLRDGPIAKLQDDSFNEVMSAKVVGTWNLHLATRGRDLDAFVLFSSVTASLGAPGQGNYAAANEFMDALAHNRRRMGLPAVAIDWGPWGEIGMAARLSELMASRGMAGIKTHDGLDAVLAHGADHAHRVLYMDMRVRDLHRKDPRFKTVPFLREVIELIEGPEHPSPPAAEGRVTNDAPVAVVQTALGRLARVPATGVEATLLKELARLAEDQLGVDPGTVSPTRPLSWQGFDSVMALDLARAIEDQLGVRLDQQTVTVGPPLKELAELILPRLDLSAASKEPVAPTPADTPSADSPLSRLAALPQDARAEALLQGLTTLAEQQLGVDAGEVSTSRPLSWQGFDSVMALDLSRAIETAYGVTLDTQAVPVGPPLKELAELVASALQLDTLKAPRVSAAPPTGVSAASVAVPDEAPAPFSTYPTGASSASSEAPASEQGGLHPAVYLIVALLLGGLFLGATSLMDGTDTGENQASEQIQQKAKKGKRKAR